MKKGLPKQEGLRRFDTAIQYVTASTLAREKMGIMKPVVRADGPGRVPVHSLERRRGVADGKREPL